MNLDKGTSITLTADGIGEIKSQMEQLVLLLRAPLVRLLSSKYS